MEDAERLSDSIAEGNDNFNYRRGLTLTEDEKIRLFGRMAASLGAKNGSVAEFLRKEVEACNLADAAADDPDKWLVDGKPTKNERMFIRELHSLVRDHGQGFAKAAAHFPGVFDPVLLAFLRAGEAKGEYQPVLRLYVVNAKKRKELREKIMGALLYPMMVCAAAVVVVTVFAVFVIPRFKDFYVGLLGPGEELPWPTRLVMGISDFVVNWWWAMAGGLAFLVFGYGALRRRNPEIRLKEERRLMRLKWVGPLLLKQDLINFLRTFAMLKEAGALPTDALRMAAATMRFYELQDAVNDCVDTILGANAESIHMGLARKHGVFSAGTPFFNEMKGWEESGSLSILYDYADLLESNADRDRDQLLRMLEPALIFILGGIIGFLVIALYMPLFDLVAKIAARQFQ